MYEHHSFKESFVNSSIHWKSTEHHYFIIQTSTILCQHQLHLLTGVQRRRGRVQLYCLEWTRGGMRLCVGFCAHETIIHTPVSLFLIILSCSKFGEACWVTVCWAHKRRCSCAYFRASLVLVVQDLIKVLTLEEACVIAQGLMRHTSIKLDCRWNGHTFHASSCRIWMDVGTSSTKRICKHSWVTDGGQSLRLGEPSTVHFHLHIASGDLWARKNTTMHHVPLYWWWLYVRDALNHSWHMQLYLIQLHFSPTDMIPVCWNYL